MALGRHDESKTLLRSGEQRYGDPQAYTVTEAYVFRGDLDAAFRWLDRAHDLRAAVNYNPRRLEFPEVAWRLVLPGADRQIEA